MSLAIPPYSLRPFGNRPTLWEYQEIVTRPLTDPLAPSDICLARLAQSKPTGLMEAFAAFCRAWFAQGVGD